MRRMGALVLRPPLVPTRLQPQAVLQAVTDRSRAAVSAVVGVLIELIDLNQIVAKIDVNAIAAQLDVEAIIDQIDLDALVQHVMEDVDLPTIIRNSTGVMASESVLSMRMQGFAADERVSNIVDKLMLRQGTRKTQLRK
jgi:predicted RNase H-like nuclease